MNAPRVAPLWSVPLVWFTIAVTAGIVADRYLALPPYFSLAAVAAFLATRLLVVRSHGPLKLACFLGAAAFLGAAWHRSHQDPPSGRALRALATPDGTPLRFTATLVAPVQSMLGGEDPMQSLPRDDSVKLLLDVSAILDSDGSRPMTGRIAGFVGGKIESLYPGDVIEIQGKLFIPMEPGNPGEFDRVQDLRDQEIAAILSAPRTPDAVRLRERRWPSTFGGWLGRLQQACKDTLDTNLRDQPALAAALLLGDGSALGGAEWEKFMRSGVIHALAISGQHLVVLAWFLLLLRRIVPIPLRTSTWILAGILVGYALLTGGRPPVMRAAWVVVAMSLAVLLRRPVPPAATLAFAWLGVVVTNPADIFTIGCQLSFLAVILLRWAVTPLLTPSEEDPLDTLQRELDSPVQRVPWWLGRSLKELYVANAIVWLGVTPLAAAKFHTVAPIALLIGPPVVFFTSVGLITGFLLLLLAPLLGPLVLPLAWTTDFCLLGCEHLVDWGLRLPGASFYVADIPDAWLWAFHLGLLATLWVPRLTTRSWLRWIAPLGGVWLAFGIVLAFGLGRDTSPRISFLAVGHGGCTVIQTSSGRTLVYDAGAMTGPDVTRRFVAPYLWSRGLRVIDELYISHADLDHFSGVPALLDRVTVRRVNLTPTFGDRTTPGVRRVLEELRRRSVPMRILTSGDADTIDDVRLDVLHPPARGPDGKENARSMVLYVRTGGISVLLTGDLEEAGLERVLTLRRPELDVLMAPHHGSRTANTAALADWARPRFVVSCQGRPRSIHSPAAAYEAVGATYLTTHRDGAVTIVTRERSWWLETYRTKEVSRLGPATR
jgi:competence protein ComEC